MNRTRERRKLRGIGCALGGILASMLVPGALIGQDTPDADGVDRRVGLEAGWMDAEAASWNLELVGHRDRPQGFFDPTSIGAMAYANSDMAFSGSLAFLGNFNGFNVYDVADPPNPELLVSVVCPGGQGDLSVFGDLLFISVQETRSRIDCGLADPEFARVEADPERFRGVRIFDVSDVSTPRQIAAVQTCRGSHTHTLVSDPNDPDNLYVYVSGTSVVRPEAELAGCSDERSPDDPNTAYWRITVIQVPLDAPENARIVNEPRVFAEPEGGSLAGLWAGGDHGPGTQDTGATTSCHDITAFPEIGLAAGACQGNGILFDISDPANPVRIDQVVDPNFAYWHSATFNNDGSKVVFTDEWGGGTSPRCLAADIPEWGANAIFDIVDRTLEFRSYYKLPAPQTETENCVAHNGSLLPVPGRDIMVQGWYQGGISVFDFTDSFEPREIAYFDRGPLDDEELMLGGYWSAYWYDGFVFGSEIARGMDVLRLIPSAELSENELAAAGLIRFDWFNAQEQPRVRWPATFLVARARLDQLARAEGVDGGWIGEVRARLSDIEEMSAGAERRASLAEFAVELWNIANTTTGDAESRLRAVAGSVLDLAGAEN